jgi:hypothetical protein
MVKLIIAFNDFSAGTMSREVWHAGIMAEISQYLSMLNVTDLNKSLRRDAEFCLY